MYRSYNTLQMMKDHHQEQKKLHEKEWIYFDVDDTLIMWIDNVTNKGKENTKKVGITLYDSTYYLYPHVKNIQLLKDLKASGKHIVVWSKGGQPWAQAAVNTLGLNNHVDYILSKPDRVVDDLKIEQILEHTDNLYINFSKKDKL